MHIMTDDERMTRFTEPRLKQATDLTDRDIIYQDGEWTEVLGVYRDMDEWDLHFGSTVPDLVAPSQAAWREDRKFAEDALDWSSDMYVVVRLLDRPNCTPGEIADKFTRIYKYEPVKVQSQPAWQPPPASQAPQAATPRDGNAEALAAFTEALLEGVAQPGNERADARLARLADAISAAAGTDGDNASWLAARVFGTLEAMRVESREYRDPRNGPPWDVAAWLESLNQ
jgi:hypothetical protein